MHLIASSGGSSSVTLPGGKMLRRSYDILSIAADDLPQTFEPKALLLGGETEIPELSLRISCRFVKKYEKSMQSLCTFAFKYDTIDEIKALCVRPRQAGDEIQLPGGGRSLKKLLIDRKVPRDARSLVPVVADRAGVLLVYPLAVSVSRQAQPGDLLFYASGNYINHVAIYIGDGKIIHSSNPTTGITITKYNYRTPCKAVTFLN